jgi:hypothetical protein
MPLSASTGLHIGEIEKIKRIFDASKGFSFDRSTLNKSPEWKM